MDVLGVVGAYAVAPASAAHLTIGGAVASVGVNMLMMISFSLLTWWTIGDEESFNETPSHTPDAVENYPLPEFLEDAGYQRSINIAVFGASGSGKSSLVNALRRKRPGDTDAAPVGVQETTTEPVSYNLIDSDQKYYYKSPHLRGYGDMKEKDYSRPVRIWDLPGAGTTAFPAESSVREMGLRYFDVVILVVGGSGSELEQNVAEELDDFKVPHFIVRSQVDCDLENEMADHNVPAHEAMKLFRTYMSQQGFPSVFMVNSRQPNEFDFPQLVGSIVASVQARRRVHKADCCPICFDQFSDEKKPCSCHWCRNSVCSTCAKQLQGKLDAAPCPFCRRWTTLTPQTEAAGAFWQWRWPQYSKELSKDDRVYIAFD